ncbi:hypothetical protein D0Y65_011770 [Glycine soja]|uniref:Uncharacterized protein n=2 Tax=Glycine soja TaxID=3848 RepID=A0A445KLI1_GLYSO|nr:hypothetical protein D0Y65_011770 [Glycine soja]
MGSKIYPGIHENPKAFFRSSSPILLESSIQYPCGMDEIQDLPLLILQLYLICTFFDGQIYQDVATRDGQQAGGILVTYVSQEDASSSREGLQIYDYRLPF